MSEVSTRALSLWFDCLRKWQISPAHLVDGTSYTLEELRRPDGRIPWDDFCDLSRNFENLIGGPERLRDAGRAFFDVPALASIGRVGALLAHPRDVYITADRYLGNIMFSVVESRFELLSPDRGRMQLWIADRYPDCPQFFRISQGTFERMPVIVGYPEAQVDLTLRPRSATYDIYMPRRPGLLSLDGLRRTWRAIRNPEQLQVEIAAQHQEVREAMMSLREAKKQAQDAESLWRGLAENAPDLIVAVDDQGRIRSANRDEIGPGPTCIGRRLVELAEGDARAAFAQALDDVLSGRGLRTIDADWVLRSGERLRLSARIGPVSHDGTVSGAVLEMRDITEQHALEEERRRLEERVARGERLESMGLLAGGIAHDFNNLLHVILMNADLASMNEAAGAVAQEIEQIAQAAEQAAQLTKQLLVYAGRAPIDRQRVDLSATVEEMSALFASVVPDSARFEQRLEAGLPEVEIDPGQLQQVVINLLANAVDALDGAPGTIVLSTRQADDESLPEESVGSVLPSGPHVVLEVSDTGPGMDAETRARIFEPFFTTKATGHGLGLATVFGVVRRHEGRIEVESEPGRGTTFRVRLPAKLGPQSQRRGKRRRPRDIPATSGVALVVDDEPAVRNVVALCVKKLGVSVVQAKDGDEALEQADAIGEDLRLVVSDVVMPGINGIQLCKALRERRPTLPVILTSAVLPTAEDLEREGLGDVARLNKPFGVEELIRLIRGALEASGEPVHNR